LKIDRLRKVPILARFLDVVKQDDCPAVGVEKPGLALAVLDGEPVRRG